MALAWFRRRSAPEAMHGGAAAEPSPAPVPGRQLDDIAPSPGDEARDVLELLDVELKGLVRQLERAAASVAGGAQSAAETLTAIRQRTDALTARSTGAQTTATSFSQAAEKFTDSAKEIGGQLRDAGRLADEAGAAARNATENVDRLQQSSSAIGQVIDLIGKIARQTTLLALNSTIEAARAGEAGRGFSVVATEVKALATQTQGAVDEIRARIEALQQDASASIATVRRISECIAAIRPVFAKVGDAVKQQGQTTDAIMHDAAATSRFIASVGDNAGQIEHATREAEEHGLQVAEAGAAVAALVDKLKSRSAILLRNHERDHDDRLPCSLAITVQTVGGAVCAELHDIARSGMLITGPGAATLPQHLPLAATIAALGDCRIRINGPDAHGVRAAFVEPDAALKARIEDMLFSIHDDNAEAIARAMQVGDTLTALFEDAVTRGTVSLDDLFDNDYVPIEGTNPQQVRNRMLAWAERALPPIQETFKDANPRLVFGVCIDRNGYLPVHNAMYSKPQRPNDPAWNIANCRNRRIFNDAAGLAAGRNTRAYLIQSYPRDMGNGAPIWMREIDVPIKVRGRHWGGFRTAYRL